MVFLICAGQKRWSSQAETQSCCPGSPSPFWCPSCSPGTFPCCEFKMCWDWEKDSEMKRKAHTGKGYYRLRGTFRNTRDLISVYTTVNEPCTALVSKNFSLAHSFSQIIAGQKLFCEIGVLLTKKITPTPAHASSSSFQVQEKSCLDLPGQATGPSDHCKTLHVLLLPLPPRGMRKPEQNT